MKRLILYSITVLSLFFLINVCLFGEVNEEYAIQHYAPQILGAGGSHIGLREGLPILFTNPAFLTESPATITYFSLSTWLHSEIEHLIPAFVDVLSGSVTNSTNQFGIKPLLENNGLGMGGNMILGYYGDNFAGAVSIVSDLFFYGDSYPTEIYSTLLTDTRLTLSFAYPIDIEDVRIAIGLTVEPFYRLHTFLPADQTQVLLRDFLSVPVVAGNSYLSAENSLYGGGVSFHAGVLVKIINTVSIGISLREIADTRIFYSRTSLQNLLNNLSLFSLPSIANPGDAGYIDLESESFTIPMKVRFGVAYHPYIKEAPMVEPTFSVEISELVFSLDEYSDSNFLHALHLGAQVRLYKWFTAQIGLSQGQFTLGTGFDLGIFEIHSAWFGQVVPLPNKYVKSHGLIISFQFNDIIPEIQF